MLNRSHDHCMVMCIIHLVTVMYTLRFVGYPRPPKPVLPLSGWYKLTYLVLTRHKTILNQSKLVSKCTSCRKLKFQRSSHFQAFSMLERSKCKLLVRMRYDYQGKLN